MIISDTHRVAFVHVPKCAGNTARQYLQALDETGGVFTSRTAEHPALGRIDYAHIPLFVLREHFPDEYRKLLSYSTYALVRDPYDRFPSSVAQHLARFGPGPLRSLGDSVLVREIDRIISFLEDTPAARRYLPVEYVHFQRQTDFVFDRGRRVVGNVFGIEDLDEILTTMGEEVGRPLAGPRGAVRKNETLIYRNELVRLLAEAVEPLGGRILPEPLARRLQLRIKRRVLVPRRRRPLGAFDAPRVRAFVRRYYAEDVSLYRSAVAARPGHETSAAPGR